MIRSHLTHYITLAWLNGFLSTTYQSVKQHFKIVYKNIYTDTCFLPKVISPKPKKNNST